MTVIQMNAPPPFEGSEECEVSGYPILIIGDGTGRVRGICRRVSPPVKVNAYGISDCMVKMRALLAGAMA